MEISTSTYHEYILEAISALRFGLQYNEEAKLVPKDVGSDSSIDIANMYTRYSFLMRSNSIEAAANALLISVKLNKKYYEELERLNTMLKFQIYCNLNGKRLNQGDVKYARIKEIINCRNEFVHPKPKIINVNFTSDDSEIGYEVKKTKNRNYPLYFIMINPYQVIDALEDTLAFISWICFDICKFSIKEGAMKLGLDSTESRAEILDIGELYSRSFDRRSFGVDDSIDNDPFSQIV